MPEEIVPGLFRIEVPLPKNPLQSINSYVIKGKDRHLVVDTGMNRPECQEAILAGFAELEVDSAHTDFFVTHFHADHLGLVTQLTGDSSKVYFNEPEAEFVRGFRSSSGFWKQMAERTLAGGFPIEEAKDSLTKHPGVKYGSAHVPDFTIVAEGDTVSAGEYSFECVSTPGHTMGHMCLYERDKKIMLSGDHVLGDITPNITSWSDDLNPLADYLASLDKVREFDVQLVLPGHRRTFTDFRGRIDELKHHHEVRAAEVLSVVDPGGNTVYEVASKMTWDIDAASWDAFPVMQKWFATGEAGTHLYYLEQKGLLRREMRDGKIVFLLP